MPLGTICCRGFTLIRLRSDVITSFSIREFYFFFLGIKFPLGMLKFLRLQHSVSWRVLFFHLPPLPGKERLPSASSIYGEETFIFYPQNKKKNNPILHYRSWLVEWLLICSLDQCFYFLPKHSASFSMKWIKVNLPNNFSIRICENPVGLSKFHALFAYLPF